MLIHDLTLDEVKAYPEAVHAFLTHDYICANGHLFNEYEYEINEYGDSICPCCYTSHYVATEELDEFDTSECLGYVIANEINDEPYTKQHFDNMEKAGEL